ncbi:hypothetical protein Tco_0645107, partial [Tanacetum coccineum]
NFVVAAGQDQDAPSLAHGYNVYPDHATLIIVPAIR